MYLNKTSVRRQIVAKAGGEGIVFKVHIEGGHLRLLAASWQTFLFNMKNTLWDISSHDIEDM